MNWISYKESLSKLSKKQKGDSFERLTQHYLKYEPQYATKLKEVWLLSEVPAKIHKKLNLPDQDQGIDLICETKDGEYWAVQSKYHEDERTNQTWKSLSTFTGLAFGICKNISFGLVCSTAERFTKTLKNQDNIGFCASEVWRELDEEYFDTFVTKRKPKKIKPYKPFPHQKKAIKNAYSHFIKNKESRGKMIMPCGAGKSLTAFWIAEKLDAKRIIVAVPSLNLIRQTLNAWLRESIAKGWEVDWITVCSDPSAGEVKADDLVVLKQDLGVPAITNPKILAQFLRKKHKGKVIVFTTYQSGKAIAEASKISQRNFDLGIMDEAHKTVGAKDKSFAHLVLDKNITIKKRIFMTATERRYRGSKENFLTMDQSNIYGETFDLLSFKGALNQDPPILSDYKIVTVTVSNQEIAELVKTGKFIKPSGVKWKKEVEADTFASLVALRKAIKIYNIKHSISFHSSIARAETYGKNQTIFSSIFPDYGKIDNFHVSGKMPTSIRSSIMKDFENSKKALITNARCLTEGVDIPAIDCVLFADPKKSTVDIVQAIGRALRLHKGKKYGYVIIPVVIDKEGEGFEESKAFQSILMTLRALASNDERIVEYFRDRANKKRTNNIFNIEIDTQLAEKIDEKKFVRQLDLKAWDKLARLSWMPFYEAREYVHSLQFKGTSDWKKYYHQKVPKDIPVTPNRIYPEWKNWGDWFGTGYLATQDRKYWSFEKLRKKSRKLNLKSQAEWKKVTKNNPDFPINEVPVSPEHVYKNKGWVSWGDFLGYHTPGSIPWMEFEEAREFARKLNLNNTEEWFKYCKGKLHGYDKKPDDLPTSADGIYRNKGWLDWADFLGTEHGISRKRYNVSFVDARKFARSLKLTYSSEWYKYCKGEIKNKPPKPMNIPLSVDTHYKRSGDWKGWPDFLGSNYIPTSQRKYLTYEKAKTFARNLDLKSTKEWKLYINGKMPSKPAKPNNIPNAPHQVYNDKGWIDWADFLGTDYVKGINYRSYNEAHKFVSALNLKSFSEWQKYCKGVFKDKPSKPIDIPHTPTAYQISGDWKGWKHFLGTNIDYWSFNKSRKFVRRLNLKSIAEWKKYKTGKIKQFGKMPKEIPTVPENAYKNKGWIDYKDWLNISFVAPLDHEFLPFEEARKKARKFNITSYSHWREWVKEGKKPDNIPYSPGKVYKKEWKGWGDWLGTNRIAERNKKYLPFEEAKKLVQTFNIINREHWRNFTKTADQNIFNSIPKTIPLVYGKHKKWKGEKEFFNWPDKTKKYISYDKAKMFASKIGIKSYKEWLEYCRGNIFKDIIKPENIPSTNVDHYYKKTGEWVSWPDFLGNNTFKPRDMDWMSFEEARTFVHSLKLKRQLDWNAYCKGDHSSNIPKKPLNLPTNPDKVYKDKGWENLADFLGYDLMRRKKR